MGNFRSGKFEITPHVKPVQTRSGPPWVTSLTVAGDRSVQQLASTEHLGGVGSGSEV